MDELFVGRIAELDYLNKIYDASGPKVCAVTGRRQIGKSTLIKRFCGDKRSLILQFNRGSVAMNLQMISNRVSHYTDEEVEYGDFESFLEGLRVLCSTERMVVVFDEFPFLAEDSPYITSSVQRFIDQDLISTDSMLIVCGSSVSMMKHYIEDRNEPLYGRIRHCIELAPLGLAECQAFHPGMSDTDQLRTYLTVGGVPAYHLLMSNKRYETNVVDCFFSRWPVLTGELSRMVESELSPVRTYSGILNSIAKGINTQSMIASENEISQSLCNRYLGTLERIGFIERRTPMLKMTGKGSYHIVDPLLAFGFKIVNKNNGIVLAGDQKLYRHIMLDISTYMGRAFENVVATYIRDAYNPIRIGKWEGTSDGERTDIDVVADAYNDDGLEITILCECKFKKELASFTELNRLQRRADDARCGPNRRYMIASVSGFTDSLMEYAKENDIMLVDMDKLMGRAEPDPIWPKRDPDDDVFW